MSADADTSELRQLAREEPEAVRRVAELRDDDVRKWLLRILEEEDCA